MYVRFLYDIKIPEVYLIPCFFLSLNFRILGFSATKTRLNVIFKPSTEAT